MFKLGEMFVAFTGKDSGLQRTMKMAEASGKGLMKIFQTAMKEGGKIGVAGVKGFTAIGVASAKASTMVAKSFERMVGHATKAASRMAPPLLRSFDRIVASASKLGVAGLKSFTTLGNTGLKQITPLSKMAGGLGGSFMGMAGSIASAATATSGSFSLIGTAAAGMWTAVTAGLTAVVALTVGLGALGVTSLLMASNAQEMQGKFDVVFGSSAPKAKKEIEALAAAMGRSETDLRGMASGIQDLLVPIGFARDKAAGMSVSISQLAVDMASFNNKSDSEVVEDISAALAGSGEVMKKYGVILNETTLKQEMAKMGYTGAAEGASEQMKALARLNIIIAGTSDAHGDAVRTGGNFANQMKRIMALVMDVGRIVGQIFLPAAEVFAQFFSSSLQDIKDNTGFVETWGETLKGYAEVAVLNIGRVIALFQNWGEISKQAGNVVMAAQNSALQMMLLMLDNVEIAIGAFFNNIIQFFPNLGTAIAQTHGSIWQFLKKGWGEIWDFVKSGGQNAIELDIGTMLKNMKNQFEGPEFKPLNTNEVFAEWDKLTKIIDAKLAAVEKKAGPQIAAINAFDAADMGVDMKNKTFKFEMVDVGGLFKKNLQEAFEDKEKDKALIVAEAGVELQKEELAVQKETRDKITKAVEPRPIIA